MKFSGRCILVTFMALLLTMTGLPGCFGGGKPYVDLMQKVPIEARSFSYWAIDRMAEDRELWDIYGEFMDSPEANQITGLGIARSSVFHIATAYYANLTDTSIRVLKGDVSVGDVERRLSARKYEKELVNRTSIWTPPDQKMRRITVQEGIIFMAGNTLLQACISVVNEEESLSYFEDQNIRAVTDRVPHGVLVQITKAGLDPEEEYRDLVAYGKSYRTANGGKLEITAVYMFQDNPSAGMAGDEVKAYLENNRFTDIKLKHDGSFIIATGLIDITVFANTIAF